MRPFGVSTVLGGVDEDGPALYMIEPSGVYWGYNGCAIGKGRQLAKTEIEKLSLGKGGMTTKEAVQHAANMCVVIGLPRKRASSVAHCNMLSCLSFPTTPHSIYKCHDDNKDKDFEMELSWICPESGGKHQTVPADIVKVRAHFAAWNSVRAFLMLVHGANTSCHHCLYFPAPSCCSSGSGTEGKRSSGR